MVSNTTNRASSSVTPTADKLIIQAFAKLDELALGVAVGTTAGLGIFFATVFLVLKDGSPVGPNLLLLSQFFFGYTVTFKGSLIGFAYGFIFGFVLGWFAAFLRNCLLNIYLRIVKFKANMLSYRDLMD